MLMDNCCGYFMTKIIIAPDSFKGSLTAVQAATIISEALQSMLPDAEIIPFPLADGGEGTREVLTPFLSAEQHLIESAELIGLNLPEMSSINIFQRGSAALGDAILRALDDGKRDFIITLGGSATNDAGLGMLMSLGMDAWDGDGYPVEPTLAGLLKLERINISKMDRRLSECRFTVLSDVMSPLCGKKGATAVYGPQKGIALPDVEPVDRAISIFSKHCSDLFGFDPRDREGAGAAGGLGYALMLIGGQVVSGADYVIKMTGFKQLLDGVDWVITGEGCSDLQTLNGKLPVVVADEAKSAGIPIALLSGSVEANARDQLSKQFDLILSAQPDDLSSEDAMLQAETLLTEASAAFAERVKYDHSVS